MKRWKLIGGIGLVFIVGVLVGSAGSRLYHNRLEQKWKDPAVRTAFFFEKLSRELRLSEDQRKKVKPMIDEMDRKREAVNAERRAEIREIMDDGFSLMKEELDAEQTQKLNEMKAGYEERVKKRRGPPKGFR
jgi:Spy/CpxP family protein refolding chaperone